jgi:zinc protease
MKRIVSTSIAALWLAIPSLTLDAASAEDLLRAHAKAIGGVEAHKKLTSRVLKGELRMPEQGLTGQILIQAKAPDKLRTELDIPGVGKMIEGYDGKVAWSDNPFVGLMEKPAEQLAQVRRQADFYRDVELFSRYESWMVQGKETVAGKPVHVLEGKSKDGSTETIYLDQVSHRIAQARTYDAGVEATIRLQEYREVDGVTIPFRIEINAGPAGNFLILLSEVKHGVALDDKLFAMPSR